MTRRCRIHVLGGVCQVMLRGDHPQRIFIQPDDAQTKIEAF